MKKLLLSPLVLLMLSLLFIWGCKKTKTIDVSFSVSSASVNRGDPATVVYVELSQASDDVVELDLKSIGTTPIKFGSYEQVFLHDDSQKCEVTVDAHAFIDTAGHIKITPGAKHVAVTFKPLYDNFPHAAASYKVQITAAKNANIKSGGDVFTYNIGSADVSLVFQSTINYSGIEFDFDSLNNQPKSGVFNLQSNTFVKNGSNYDLTLNYAFASGNSSATSLVLTYNGIQPFQFGPNTYSCLNTANVTFKVNPLILVLQANQNNGWDSTRQSSSVTFDCNSFASHVTHMDMELSHTPSPVYGSYNTLSGSVNAVIQQPGDTTTFSGPITSPFFIYLN